MRVYVDILVTLNVFVNYFLLLAAEKILRIHIKKLKLFLGAFAGGLYSLVIFMPPVPDIVTFIMNTAASVLIVIIAFSPRKFKQFLKDFSAFFAVNFAFAGLMLAVWIFIKPEGMVFNNSVVYFDIDIKILVISTIFCYLVLSLISFLSKRNSPDNKICDVTLYNKGRSIMTKALIDTGNSLSDGFSQRPVVVADKSTVKELLGFSLNDCFDGNNALTYQNGEKMRLVPFNCVGSAGMLPAIKIDAISLQRENITVDNVLLAQSKTDFTSGEFRLILNSDILNERGQNNERNDKTSASENKKLSFQK